MGMGNENDHHQETRTVYYRMPTNSSAPPNAMQNMMMMSGMPPRGPPRFNVNNNPGKFIAFSHLTQNYEHISIKTIHLMCAISFQY